jgi:hypothetical protein
MYTSHVKVESPVITCQPWTNENTYYLTFSLDKIVAVVLKLAGDLRYLLCPLTKMLKNVRSTRLN